MKIFGLIVALALHISLPCAPAISAAAETNLPPAFTAGDKIAPKILFNRYFLGCVCRKRSFRTSQKPVQMR